MTRHKPLTWQSTDAGDWPDCGPCMEHMTMTPHLHEAVASVSIEHPTTPDALMRRYIEAYHGNGHKEHR
jgi:hypothetical protein